MEGKKIDRQIRKIVITDRVFIKFAVLSTQEPDEDDGEEESSTTTDFYVYDSSKVPDELFLDAMKSLRKHALEICEMEIVDKKNYTNWNVSGIDISGDMTMQKSRLVMQVAKKVEATDKIIKFKTPQVTMYGESKYHDAAKLTALVEKVCNLAFAHIDQMSLFEKNAEPKLQLHFEK